MEHEGLKFLVNNKPCEKKKILNFMSMAAIDTENKIHVLEIQRFVST